MKRNYFLVRFGEWLINPDIAGDDKLSMLPPAEFNVMSI